MAGVLAGIRIVELAGLAPAPFAGMMLADHGAEVIRIERAGHKAAVPPEKDILRRNRSQILSLDLKSEEGRAQVRELARSAEGFIEGFRPGVAERLGLGPDSLVPDNPRLVYGRMTGWGQEGPLADSVGHDINYIAVAGNLHTYGQAGAKRFTKERTAFGKSVFDFQNTRFELADMATKLQVGWAHLDGALQRHIAGELTATEASAAKLWHTELQGEICDRAPASWRRRLYERISDRPSLARCPRHPHLRRHQRNHEGSDRAVNLRIGTPDRLEATSPA